MDLKKKKKKKKILAREGGRTSWATSLLAKTSQCVKAAWVPRLLELVDRLRFAVTSTEEM